MNTNLSIKTLEELLDELFNKKNTLSLNEDESPKIKRLKQVNKNEFCFYLLMKLP
jgi:hypothetical protein